VHVLEDDPQPPKSAARIQVLGLESSGGSGGRESSRRLAEIPALPAGLQTGARPTSSAGTARLFLTAPRDVARLFRAVLATVQRHVERAGAGRLRFALGVREGRAPVATYASWDLVLEGA
jgi:hypothetical protein